MKWSEFTLKEKRAIIQSLTNVANANGFINSSEGQFLNLTILMMRENFDSFRFMMEQEEMVITIKNMSDDKKDIIATLWLECASRSTGGRELGNISLSSFPKERETIIAMARDCNVKVREHMYIQPW